MDSCSQGQSEIMDCQENQSKNREDTRVPSEPSWIVNHIKGLISSKDSSYSEAVQASGGRGKDSSLPATSSVTHGMWIVDLKKLRYR